MRTDNIDRDRFVSEGERIWEDIQKTFPPMEAILFLQSATAKAIVMSTDSREDALSTAYRFHRNLQKGIKEFTKK